MNEESSRFEGPPLVEVDGNGDPLSTVVVEAIAAVSNTLPDELSPLYDVVDPDALDSVFDGSHAGRVVFPYCGFVVCVHADDRISVYEPDPGRRIV